MKKTYINRTICVFSFVILFCALFWFATYSFNYKSLKGPWDMTVKVLGFYNQEEEVNDIVFCGPSHIYCSVDPVLFGELTGMSSYVFSTQQQPVWLTYYYMEEAIRTQSPDTIVVEIHMISETIDYYDSGTNHAALDYMEWSFNKAEAIFASVEEEDWGEYFFTLIKYHTRWEELTEEDYDFSYLASLDSKLGYVELTESLEYDATDVVSEPWLITDINTPSDKTIEYLEKMVELCAKNDVELIFIKAPTNPTLEETLYYNYMEGFALDNNVEFYNFNNIDCGLEAGDFYDRRHLNNSGVQKFLPVMIETIWGEEYLIS